MSTKKIWLPPSTTSGFSFELAKSLDRSKGIYCLLERELPQPLDLHCSQCSDLLMDPQKVTCCNKNFCLKCVDDTMAYNSPCTKCRAASFVYYSNGELRDKVASLRVHCPNLDSGCKWVGLLSDLLKHQCKEKKKPNASRLGYQPSKEKQSSMKCPHCFQVFTMPAKLQRHVDFICDQRPYTCQYCNDYKSTFKDVMRNHKVKCKHRPTFCPNRCGESILQVDMIHHLQNDCPKAVIKCDFAPLGCKDHMARCEYHNHSNREIIPHLHLVVKKLNEMSAAECQMRSEIDELRENNRKLEAKLQELEEKDQTYTEMPTTHSKYFSTSETVIAEFTMKNYSKMKRDNSSWSSHPFYTSQKGHKIYLQVLPNGHGNYKGMSISAFFHKTIGEFDDQLPSQFMGTLALQLVCDKRKVPAYRVVISVEGNSSPIYSNMLPSSCTNRGPLKTVPDFIEHSVVSRYLDNDGLVFRVSRLNL